MNHFDLNFSSLNKTLKLDPNLHTYFNKLISLETF